MWHSFYAMRSSASTPFNTTRDFALWLWTAHNTVNETFMKEEASLGTGDPKYPKLTWPPKSLCPSCYLSVPQKNNKSGEPEWDFDEIFKFLVDYYGKKLVSSQKWLKTLKDDDVSEEEVVTATNAVVVPIGAAMAIAVASCAFGALACVWRSRQKSRKVGELQFRKYRFKLRLCQDEFASAVVDFGSAANHIADAPDFRVVGCGDTGTNRSLEIRALCSY
ncbi:Sulfhydryl oxidase 1-like protein [Drosera capensis]